MAGTELPPSLVYVHGVAPKPREALLTWTWDMSLLGAGAEARSTMAYWADLMHPALDPVAAPEADAFLAALTAKEWAALQRAEGFAPETTDEQLTLAFAAEAALKPRIEPTGPLTRVVDEWTAAWVEDDDTRVGAEPVLGPLGNRLLKVVVRFAAHDVHEYLFTENGEVMRERLRRELRQQSGPFVLIAHSLGSVIAYDVLHEQEFAATPVHLFLTLGSPLSFSEIRNRLRGPQDRVPPGVQKWVNVADPRDWVPGRFGWRLHDNFHPTGTQSFEDIEVCNWVPHHHHIEGYLAAARALPVAQQALDPTPSD